MSGTINFLRNYQFLNLTKSVTEAQMCLYKEPPKTWSDVGNKLFHISCYNGLSVATVGADVATYLAISTLRRAGFFLPLPPAPPVFPTPHDSVQFIDCAVKRALWDWDPAVREELEEGIECSLSDKWNVFQVVGEWSLAYSLENGDKGSYYKPNFLTISEPLERGESFRSVSLAFASLWQKDKKKILNALYHQTGTPSLGYKAAKIYKDIRALASKLHQGNQMFLAAFNGYVTQKEQAPIARPVSSAPAAPYYPVLPSAPVFSLANRNVEVTMARDVKFLRSALMDAPYQQQGISPELLARFTMLRGFKQAFQEKNAETPAFLPWNVSLRNGKHFRSAGQEFAFLSESEYTRLRNAIGNALLVRSLTPALQEKLRAVDEFAAHLARNADFLKVYDALRIDLLAD